MSAPTRPAKPAPPISRQRLAQLAAGRAWRRRAPRGGEAGLLERVGEGVVADVVQQGGEPDGEAVLSATRRQLAPLLEGGERPAGQVVGAEGVLEAGVGGAGIDEEGVAELADVAEALDGRGVERERAPARSRRMLSQSGSRMTSRSAGSARGRHHRARPRHSPPAPALRTAAKFSRNMRRELAGLGVVGRAVGPGAARVEHSARDAGHGGRDLEAEDRVRR